jgi:xanthine dehydrogenase accessory factor
MNSTDILSAAQRLQQQGQPYALVSVLRVLAPASARPGDKAVVTAEGIVQGWIGGGCAQPAVMRTVRLALQDGRARVIRIAPAEDGSVRQLDDVLEFGMACHSGGTLELFVDPMLPAARLTVIGDTPLAAALTALAPRVGLPVTVIAAGADAARFVDAERVLASDEPAALAAEVAPGSFVVVATQGRRDVQGLRAALALRARQVFFVASARKGQVLKAALLESGEDAAAVAAIVAPAGQAIGAQTPEEIALSVLAAVVAARRGSVVPVVPVAEPASSPVSASVPRKPLPLPLPEIPAIAGSCCGGGAAAALAAALPVALTVAPPAALPAALPAPSAIEAQASTPTARSGGSCCGN